jgi:2-oxoisovalerate dehydrogenase E2 component (dihydrolipoyl transacylase)
MATDFRMPQLGESVVEGTVAGWLKSVGDRVERYEPLLEVITDKVNTEITSPDAGIVLQIYVAEGETVQVGKLLACIGEQGESFPAVGSPEALVIEAPHSAPLQGAAPKPDLITPPVSAPLDSGEKPEPVGKHVSPVVARIAAEQRVDLSRVPGTGRGGRVSKNDILRYIEMRDATVPRESEPSGLLPLTPMRKAIAEHMVRSVHTSPHVSTIFEIDASRIVAHRSANMADFARQGVRLTYTSYFVLAVVDALKAVPVVNSTFTQSGIQLKHEINVGVAVATDEGLIVPVVKNADGKSLLDVAGEVQDLAQRAREKRLRPDEVQGGTFTITNHGVSGSLVALPIINQPQAAILGVGLIQKRVVVAENDTIAVRPMAYLSLTFDHRILDGAVADRFMLVLKQGLESWT